MVELGPPCGDKHPIYYQQAYVTLICTETGEHKDKHYDNLYHMEWDV